MSNQLPAIIKRDLDTAKLPESYEDAKKALVECVRLDECKEWVSRMAAIASYARQSQDTSMEELAVRIRRRAERRLGELLTELPNRRKPKDKGPTERTHAGRSVGLKPAATAQLVRVASVPNERFESRLRQSPPPSLRDLDPAWEERLSRATTIDSYTQVQIPLSQLAALVLDRRISPRMRAREIMALELPESYIEGLKYSAQWIGEWLDELSQNLKFKEKSHQMYLGGKPIRETSNFHREL